MIASRLKLPHVILKGLSSLYDGITLMRNSIYDRGICRSFHVDVPVISVGNISAGGTGKTPLVMALARSMRERGLSVVIISRGYGGSKGRYPVRVPADGFFTDYGDEPVLMARSLTDVPVIVSRDRVKGAIWSIHHFQPHCILLDDGFQHRRLSRDLNIIVSDSRNPFSTDALLPAGTLRERTSSLRRADIVVFTHCDEHEPSRQDTAYLGALKTPPMIFHARHLPSGIRTVWTRAYLSHPKDSWKVGLISGIGSPAGFRKTAQAFGLDVCYEHHFPDHHAFSREEWRDCILEAKKSGCSHIVITAKDESRFPLDMMSELPVMVLDLVLDISDYESLLARITSRIKPYEHNR